MPTPKSRILLPHLRAWRLHALMTQDDVAAAAGVGKATVVRAEGGSPVNALTAAKIARSLHVSVKQLESDEPEGGQ